MTYTLHIMLRFEIEKMLINENLDIKELPELWNQKMKEYLGITAPDFKNGVMQDIHWSMGYFGYFPTYALGNLYAVPIYNQAQKDIADFEGNIKTGNLKPLRTWLGNQVHKLGRQKSAEDLMVSMTGHTLSAEPFMSYLEQKYSLIYNI